MWCSKISISFIVVGRGYVCSFRTFLSVLLSLTKVIFCIVERFVSVLSSLVKYTYVIFERFFQSYRRRQRLLM